jgi:hypothetical protein
MPQGLGEAVEAMHASTEAEAAVQWGSIQGVVNVFREPL